MATQKESIIPIPDEYQMTFKRLLNRVPKKKRRDKKLQETLLTCMKLGGEELTRQRIKLEKTKFAERPELFKRRIPVVPKEPVESTTTVKVDETKAATESAPAADEKTTATESTSAVVETKAATKSAPAADEKTAVTESTPTTDETKVAIQ